MAAPGSTSALRFELRDPSSDIVLDDDGFHFPTSARASRAVFAAYDDLTHVAATDRALWIATRRDVSVLPRSRFVDERGPEHLVGVLVDRIARRPGGVDRVRQMAELDARGRRPLHLPATRALLVACIVGFLFQLVGSIDVYMVAFFNLHLFLGGDWWRPVTANLIHGFPLHLAVNLFGLWLLGRLAERGLGSLRTICVMAVSGVAAMLTSGILVSSDVVGVSGVVLGLAAAVVWVDVRCASELPAWWRFPRRLRVVLMLALLVDLGIGFRVPMIAAEAHLGGFLAGLAVAMITTRGRRLAGPVSRPVSSLAAFAAAWALVSVGVAAFEVNRGDYAIRNVDRLLEDDELPAELLNNIAWMIAIDDDATRSQLRGALRFAERAVEMSEGEEPTLLDTLAEVQFQLGRPEEAILIIDRAISLDPNTSYYREQRKRFTGERDPDDRPPDPGLEIFRRDPPPLPPDREGLTA